MTWIAGLSGCIWGLLGCYFSENSVGTHVWFAAPLGFPIGIAAFYTTRWTYEKSCWVLVPTAITSTIIAVALFGLCVGLADLTRDIPNRKEFSVVIQNMLAYLFGLLTMPPFWTFFILSFGNHGLLRFLIRRNSRLPDRPDHTPKTLMHD